METLHILYHLQHGFTADEAKMTPEEALQKNARLRGSKSDFRWILPTQHSLEEARTQENEHKRYRAGA